MPWKPQYNEKLHIKLTKESPLVLVLSQLDNRYYRGLQGQYNFRLQFRLHEEGSPGAEEYIVRSHGNYLMDRSVSVELPSLGPGNYVVFISVIGERDTRVLSTEDVIKRECKGREENEKLAQVGQAYDMAHSKAASHLERLANVRKMAESKKASESRKKERRKNWEKRQTGRDIAKKQKSKDEAKKAREKAAKKAKAEAEANAKAATGAAQQVPAEREAAEEDRKKQAEVQPTHKGVQTEGKQFGLGERQAEADADNASTTSTLSSFTGTPQYTPLETPKSEPAQPVENDRQVDVPSVEKKDASNISGGPPPQPQQCPTCSGSILADAQKPLELKVHYCSCSTCKPPRKVDESDGYSSDSPVEDYELLYDEDDVTPTLRLAGSPGTTTSTNSNDSEEEDMPEPWNAIAVIGFRVYSKDEDLELRVVMEGGELEQDGMGSLGEVDLDNAVSNAAGQREKKQEEEQVNKKDGQNVHAGIEGAELNQDQVPAIMATRTPDANGAGPETKTIGQEGEHKGPENGRASYRTIIERKTSEYDRVMGKIKSDNINREPCSDEAPAVDTPTTDGDNPTAKQQSVDEKSVDIDRSAESDKEKKASPPAQTSSDPGSELDHKTKEVFYLRHKLQKGLLNRTHAPKQEDMPEMSNFLARLEAYSDLEASIIRTTKIHKVLEGVLKLKRIPRDEEFSLWSRAEALLDDFELTLVTSEDGTNTT